MKKGCLIFLGGIAAMFVLAMIGVFVLWQNKDSILETIQEATEQPEHGEEAFIESRYGSVIAAIEAAAATSSTQEELKAQLATHPNLTEQALYVACKSEGGQEIELYKQFDWQGRRISTSGNYGSGSLSASGQETLVSVYRRDGNWDYMETLIVYFEYSKSESLETVQ